MTEPHRHWPSYDELTEQGGAPPGSSWKVFGYGDQLGTINFITPECVAAAASLVRRGQVFNLDYPINAFEPYPTGTRPSATHHIFANNPNHRDDYVDSLYLQSTSQVDGLRHIRDPRYGFYGGASDDSIRVGSPELGIQQWAERGIVGRGVLLDVERCLVAHGRPLDVSTNYSISVRDLELTLADEGVQLEPGDILLIRTNWAHHYLEMDAEARHAFLENLASPGLGQTVEIVRWLWDNQVSLIAADNLGVEAFPTHGDSEFMDPAEGLPEKGVNHNGMIHRPMIALLGMALGEMWALEELAADCARDDIYEFMVACKPLNLVGGVGSPANAMAIK